jgi:hypothetical protein
MIETKQFDSSGAIYADTDAPNRRLIINRRPLLLQSYLLTETWQARAMATVGPCTAGE